MSKWNLSKAQRQSKGAKGFRFQIGSEVQVHGVGEALKNHTGTVVKRHHGVLRQAKTGDLLGPDNFYWLDNADTAFFEENLCPREQMCSWAECPWQPNELRGGLDGR